MIQHPLYVLLATTVAVLGSWTALDLFLRVRAWVGQPRAAWLIAATVAMGLSLWATHFIAMLGFDAGPLVRYDPALVTLALALALGSTGVAFAMAGRSRLSTAWMVGGGLTMGAGIGLMHYVGIAALRTPGALTYRPPLVIAAFLFAAAGSIGAMAAVARPGSRNWRMGVSSALGLTLAIAHYTAMASVRILPGTDAAAADGFGALGLAVAVAVATLSVLFLASVAALFDRRFEQVAAVEAKRGEAQLRALLEQMPMGVVVADASGAIRYANPEAEHLIGRQIGADPPWASDNPGLLDENGARRPPESFALYRAVHMGQRTEGGRLAYRRPDGTQGAFEVTAGPVRDADGRIVQGVVTFQDITAKLKAEEALRQSQRMEGIGQLTGGVAHDFNNLLTAILGNLTLASRRVEDERAAQLLENAMQAARRGARLTEQLLAFSRRQKLEARPLDANAMIARMGGLFSSTLGGTVKVVADLKSGLPPASADPSQLELALLNLALNARDAMPSGGELRLSTALVAMGPPRGDSEPEAGRYVCITVADTGRGMTPQTMARAFEPFFTTKTEGKGSGLGLSQVLGLAKQLGGGVGMESAPGEGCAVSIYLPLSDEPAPEPLPSAPSVAALQGAVAGRRVLVVDDDDDVRRFVSDLLTESGCRVHVESDGLAGLAALEDGAYDLMLLDFAMPGMTGAELAGRVRERRPDMPILIMTGYLEHEAVLTQLGDQPVLQKPFEPVELLARIVAMVRA